MIRDGVILDDFNVFDPDRIKKLVHRNRWLAKENNLNGLIYTMLNLIDGDYDDFINGDEPIREIETKLRCLEVDDIISEVYELSDQNILRFIRLIDLTDSILFRRDNSYNAGTRHNVLLKIGEESRYALYD